MITTTLRDIRKYTSNLKKQLVFSSNYKEGDLNSFEKSYELYLGGTTKDELLKRFDLDISNTVKDLEKVQELLVHSKEGKFLEIEGETNDIREIFGSKYDKDKNIVTLNNIEFNLTYLQQNIKFTSAELKEKMSQDLFSMSYKKFKSIVNNRKNILVSENRENKIEFLSYIDKRKELEELISTIENKLDGETEFYETLDEEDKETFTSSIRRGRTMLGGVIQSSTFISQDEGIKQISSSHKKNMGRVNSLNEVVKKSKYFNRVEVDQDVHIDKFINRMNQIENFNLNVSTKGMFKRRLLGNYNRNGLYMPHKQIVSVDVKKPSRLIHEVRHHIDFNTNNKDNFEREKLIRKLKSKIDVELLEKNHSNSNYYLDDYEIIRRGREVRYMLQLDDSKNQELKKDLISEDNDTDIKVIKSKKYYERHKNIYFNFDEWSVEEKEELKTFFNSFYRIDKNLPLEPIKKGCINYDLSRDRVRDRKGFNFKTKIEEEEFYKNFNSSNMDRIIELNKKMKYVEEKDLYESILRNIPLICTEWDKEGKEVTSFSSKGLADLYGNKSIVINRLLKESKEIMSESEYNVLMTKYLKTRYFDSNLLLNRKFRGRDTKYEVSSHLKNYPEYKEVIEEYKGKFENGSQELVKVFNDNVEYAKKSGNFSTLLKFRMTEMITPSKTIISNNLFKNIEELNTIKDLDTRGIEEVKKKYEEFRRLLSPTEINSDYGYSVFEKYEQELKDYDFYIKDTKRSFSEYNKTKMLKEDGSITLIESYGYRGEDKTTNVQRGGYRENLISEIWDREDRDFFISKYEDFDNLREDKLDKYMEDLSLVIADFDDNQTMEVSYKSKVSGSLEEYFVKNNMTKELEKFRDYKKQYEDKKVKYQQEQEEKIYETYKEEINKYTKEEYGKEYCSSVEELRRRGDYMLHIHPKEEGVMSVVKYTLSDNGVWEHEKQELSTENKEFYKWDMAEKYIFDKDTNFKKEYMDKQFLEYVNKLNKTQEYPFRSVYSTLYNSIEDKELKDNKEMILHMIEKDEDFYEEFRRDNENSLNSDLDIILAGVKDSKRNFKYRVPQEIKDSISKTNRHDLFVKKVEKLIEERDLKEKKKLEKKTSPKSNKSKSKVTSEVTTTTTTYRDSDNVKPSREVQDKPYFKTLSHCKNYISKFYDGEEKPSYQKDEVNNTLSVVFNNEVIRMVDNNIDSKQFKDKFFVYFSKEDMDNLLEELGKTPKVETSKPKTSTLEKIQSKIEENKINKPQEPQQEEDTNISYTQPSLFD